MSWLIFTMSFAIVVALTKIFLNLHNISYIIERQDQVPEDFAHKITLAEHQKAARYSAAKLRFGVFNTLVSLTILILFLPLGFLNQLNELSLSLATGPVTSGLLLLVMYSFISEVLSIPISYYSTFVLEEKFGFNRTTKKLFFIDQAKSLILGLVLGCIVMAVLILVIEKVKYWWLVGWIAVVSFQFILMWAYPRFIAPLFNKFTPLQDQELAHKIEALLHRTQIAFKDIFVMNASLRSSHGNAYFTGFGKNRRIVFFDTLLKSLNHGQVEAVLAHELGHLKHKHILKSMIWATIGALGFFLFFYYLYSETQFTVGHNINQQTPAVFLILATMVVPIYTYFFTPIFTWLSRKKEFEADHFAVTYTNGDDLIEALLVLYRDNSSTLTPAELYWKFYYSHPPAVERFNHIKSLTGRTE